MSATFEIKCGYSKNHSYFVRYMTLEEIKQLHAGGQANFIGIDGKLRRVKINGSVRRWKREPDRVEVPIKYGLREFGTFDTAEALRRFVVIVPQEAAK